MSKHSQNGQDEAMEIKGDTVAIRSIVEYIRQKGITGQRLAFVETVPHYPTKVMIGALPEGFRVDDGVQFVARHGGGGVIDSFAQANGGTSVTKLIPFMGTPELVKGIGMASLANLVTGLATALDVETRAVATNVSLMTSECELVQYVYVHIARGDGTSERKIIEHMPGNTINGIRFAPDVNLFIGVKRSEEIVYINFTGAGGVDERIGRIVEPGSWECLGQAPKNRTIHALGKPVFEDQVVQIPVTLQDDEGNFFLRAAVIRVMQNGPRMSWVGKEIPTITVPIGVARTTRESMIAGLSRESDRSVLSFIRA